MMMCRWLFILVFLFNDSILAQNNDSGNYRIFELRGFSGSHIYKGENLYETLSHGYRAVKLRYGWQSSDPESWQSMYLYPAYGLGLYSGFIGQRDLLGTPGAFYGFISFPLNNRLRHQFLLEPALGVSYGFKPYHHEKNYLNDAIGSRFNVYFNLNLGGKYGLNKGTDLIYGIDITHFSNGRSFRPNRGLNMLGANLGMRYNFNTQQFFNRKNTPPPLRGRPVHETFHSPQKINTGALALYSSLGLVQNMEHMGTRLQYLTSSSWIEYQFRFTTRSGIAVGLNYFYDGSLKDFLPAGPYDFYGLHLGYDFIFWNFSFRMQAGTYLNNRGHQMKGNYFARPAFRYYINQRLFSQIGLKTQDGIKADWIEFGLGVKFKDFFNKK
jgi:hypothetical protein